MKRSLLLLLCVVFASISAYAVNMPGAPIYNSKSSARVSTDSVYKKSTSDYKAPSQAVNNGLSSANLSGNAHCMTENEYRLKTYEFTDRFGKLVDDDSSYSLEKTIALQEQEINYFKSVFPACIKYFKTTNPDCSRVPTLFSGYAWLDDEEKPAARAQMNSLPNLQGKCKTYYESYYESYVND